MRGAGRFGTLASMGRPLLSVDPGPTVLRWGWVLWTGWTMVGTALLLNDLKAGQFVLGAVLVAPFWALWLLWPVYRLWARVVRRRLGDPGGTAHEFEGRPLQVRYDDHGTPWLSIDEVAEVLGPEQVAAAARAALRALDGAVPLPGADGPALVPAATLVGWLQLRGDAVALRFARWIQDALLAAPPPPAPDGG